MDQLKQEIVLWKPHRTSEVCRWIQRMYFLLAWICFHQNKLQPAAFYPAAECWSLEGDVFWMWSWWKADVLSLLLSLSIHTHALAPAGKDGVVNSLLPIYLLLPLTPSPTPWQLRCCSLCSANNADFIQEENTSPFLNVQALPFCTKHLQHTESYITRGLVHLVQTLYTHMKLLD